MKLDPEKIDRAVLALLSLGLHEDNRTWKGFDWDAMNRLHEKGYISDPVPEKIDRAVLALLSLGLHARRAIV